MIWFQRFRERAPPFPTRLKTDEEWRDEGYTVETFEEAYLKDQSETKTERCHQCGKLFSTPGMHPAMNVCACWKPPTNTANDRDLTTWAWVDKNADDLRGDIVTHLKVYGLGPQEVEDCLRVIFISIRQWADARLALKEGER